MHDAYRLKPQQSSMITEPCDVIGKRNAVDVLCTECGWEGHSDKGQIGAVQIFNLHSCRLVTQTENS